MTSNRHVLLALIAVLVIHSNARCERVGYKFSGAFLGSASQTYSLFGKTVPRNSAVFGTLSYDTTATGANGEPGEKIYHQLISGGYALDIASGTIQLSASDYNISVVNDFGSPSSDLFKVDYNYDSAHGLTPAPILEHGTPWADTRGFVTISFFWDPATFPDPDEPKLTSGRPTTPGALITAVVGSNPIITARPFSITSISPIDPLPGDYNLDGIRDSNDFTEWRKVFDETEPRYLYADGNGNGVIDAADYVVWRDSIGLGLGLATTVPEPSSLSMIVVALLINRGISRRCYIGGRQR